MTVQLKGGQQVEAGLMMGQADALWTRNFILLCLANLTLFINMQVLLPTLPLYLVEIGGGYRDVGYVMAAYTIGAVVIRPFAGWLVDTYGRKKFVILGMLMVLLACALYGFATNLSFLMGIRAFHGLAFGMVTTALGTIVADSLPAARFGEGMGYFGLTASLSMALAPVIGLWLVGEYGYPVFFVTVGLLAVLAFGCSLLIRSAGVPAPVKPPGGPGLGGGISLLEKVALPASAVMFFLAFTYGAVLSFIALYAAELNVNNIGLFFSALAVTMIVSRPISGRWSDRGGTNMVLLIGHVVVFAGMLVVGFSSTDAGFIWAGALIGVGFGFCIPTLQALAVRPARADRRGAATSTFFVAFDLGLGIGTIIWGYVAEAAGYRVMYLLTLLPLVFAGLIYYRIREMRENAADINHPQ